jgi:hypothetical protein
MSGRIGPSLPPGFRGGEGSSDEDKSCVNIGPNPPSNPKNADPAVPVVPQATIGPCIPGPSPPQFNMTSDPTVTSGADTRTYGPALPPQTQQHDDSTTPTSTGSPTHSGDDEEDIIGPMPSNKVG